MAETINVPGLGPTKAVYVYAGGALIVGIVGYAWWKNSQNQPTDFLGASEDDFGVADYDSPLGNSGGNSTGQFDSTDPNTIDTNGEWTAFCVEKLASYGWESSAVATALGKYLARKGLTETEITIVQAAIAVAGPPPVGGPYPINNALPDPPSTGDPTPTALYFGVWEGAHFSDIMSRVKAAHPTLDVSESKLASLNPGWPDRYLAWSKPGDPRGWVPAGTPGAVRTFGSGFQLRIR